ncbi:Bug family tripartite tricarboxylate transporter substrate binding protein [Achromobacter aloeverae]|uniref:ABC transporter substrate-binding protein n=1 Tax=Achromobacter aloeverae TaxID=1750518 RepID=A0A4Q1HJT2_9BURK|nr:tripartite tricarboxylate transporter substrate binding protein [Achromobacter aloeverae]RXN90251.1 ABC transporter substrate-binding protein [Achromobacter aloeverae]
MFTKLLLAFAASASMLVPCAQAATTFPDRQMTLVVPYPPGGSTDATARLVADEMGKELGQAIVVENRAGAAGNIGANYAARAAADGYTLLMAPSGLIANMALYKNLPYDLIKDFAPVSRIARIPNVLVVSSDSKADTLKAFIDQARQAKPPMTYASAGPGTGQHLAGALFSNKTGIEMTHIPYKGGAPAQTDLMGGRVDAMFAPLVEVISLIKAGRLKALAVTTPERSFALPQVPALAELYPGFEISLWNGILAPAGTPADRIEVLNRAARKAIASERVQKALHEQGSVPAPNSPAEMKALLAAEKTKWAEIVRISGAQVE